MMNNHSKWKVTLPKTESGDVKEPKAIIVILGWFGSKPQHLQKYEDMYGEIQCITVCGVADPMAVMATNSASLRSYAQEGLEIVAQTLHESDMQLPLFFHIFSNAGGFVWQQVLKLLAEDAAIHAHSHRVAERRSSDESVDTEETPLHTNTKFTLIRKHMCGELYDSSPAYPSLQMAFRTLDDSGIVPFAPLMLLVKLLLLILIFLEGVFSWICGRPRRLFVYWDDIATNELKVPQAFIYSTIDRLTDYSHLEDLIQTRRDLGRSVSVMKFEDSPHVQHFRTHPNTYKSFVHNFVRANSP